MTYQFLGRVACQPTYLQGTYKSMYINISEDAVVKSIKLCLLILLKEEGGDTKKTMHETNMNKTYFIDLLSKTTNIPFTYFLFYLAF